MISGTDPQFHALNARYKERFGEILPLMIIPRRVTLEELTELVEECFKEGKDLLPERYDWQDDVFY